MASTIPPDSPISTPDFYECLATCQLGEIARRVSEAVLNFFIALANGIYSGFAWVCQKIYSLVTCASEDVAPDTPLDKTYSTPLPPPQPISAIPSQLATQNTQTFDQDHLASMSTADRAAIEAALLEDAPSAGSEANNRMEPPSSLARATAAQRRRPSQPSLPPEQRTALPPTGCFEWQLGRKIGPNREEILVELLD
jgi:hypothetical protein